ncbi:MULTISPECIES: hypothetical protein [unclassified Sinorhizobium]|uniref:hypothetical protein n=1 Tax=unclassified Sinorhizobium TaxID=2613772 RepID=UPI0024C302F1|nr:MULTISPECIES: hypothetical protein [unclassified Sinorhizobium]MDK1377072.1 hypothetical protein [Sinorhizobium sp. 6-70]MDK1479633.1 hypothetical protein [Sinorhizobium sp. 6-117]
MKSEHRSVPRLGLNRNEVALALGVSVNSVDLMVAEGFLPQPRRWRSRKIWIVSEIELAMLEWPVDGATADGNDWRATV